MSPIPLLAIAALAAAPPGDGDRFEAIPAEGGVRVQVSKKGLFSGFAHDHDFEVTRWRGSALVPGGDPARASMEVVLDASSLRDREKGLSDGDRRKVDAQAAGPDVLDAAHAPEITWRAERVTLDGGAAADGPARGRMHGTLTVRGKTRPVDAAFEAERTAQGFRVRGRARFRQSDFGIRPFSGFGGTVAVKDEVVVAFSIELRPARSAAR